jgi:dihydroxyacetone kinase-like predicted kinase
MFSPVPDGDTGSNLAFTLASVREALLAVRGGNVQAILDRVGSEAIDGARGNSGAILAQFLQGVSEGFAGQQFLALGQLADASGRGSRQARQAIAEPREGTMLSVIQVFAQSLGLAREQGVVDLRAGYERALVASRQALADTPNQLAVLRKAGVVDAGAQGFVHLLEGIQEFIRHGRNAQAMDAAYPSVPNRASSQVRTSRQMPAIAGVRSAWYRPATSIAARCGWRWMGFPAPAW